MNGSYKIRKYYSVLIYGGVVLVSILIGYLLLVMVYAIPVKEIDKNVKESSVNFKSEGTYPQIMRGYLDSGLDNYTDAIMLLTAAYQSEKSVFQSAVCCSRNNIKECNPTQSLVRIYVDSNIEQMVTYDYARYWHGYLIFLKPLLIIFNYMQIRYLNMAVQGSLFIIIVTLLARKKRYVQIFSLFMVWMFLNPISTVLALQYTGIWLIVLLQILLFLLLEKKYQQYSTLLIFHFLIAGCFTSYIDLLTYPLAALGIPLIFWISLHQEEKRGKQNIFLSIKSACIFGIGYTGMWVGKWILGSIITNQDIVKNALDQASLRSNYVMKEETFTYLALIKKEFSIPNKVILYSIFLFLFIYFCHGVRNYAIRISEHFIVYLFIAGFPFIWYAVLGNHSYQHAWITYRTLVVFLYGILMAVSVLVDNEKLAEYRKKKCL